MHVLGNSSVCISSGARNKTQILGYSPTAIANSFAAEVNDAQLRINPNATPRAFSESSLNKIEKATKESTNTTNEKGSQNRRRHQALNDPYNAIALCIMEMVIAGEGPIDPRLRLNTDKSSELFFKNGKMTLLSSPGIKEELKALGRNATTTKTGSEEQQRGAAYSPLTSSSGKLVAFTSHIKDHAFNDEERVSTYQLDDVNWLQTIPNGRPTTGVRTDNHQDIHLSSSQPNNDSDLAQEAELEMLQFKFDQQEAFQYITCVLLPAAIKYRNSIILADLYNSKYATTAVSLTTMRVSREAFASDPVVIEEVNRLSLSLKYRMLITIDGERNHMNVLKKMYLDAATKTNVSVSYNHFEQLPSDDSAATALRLLDFQVWRNNITKLNVEFLKLSASCSKVEQTNDVIPSGFRCMHQFWNSSAFKHFDVTVMLYTLLMLINTLLRVIVFMLMSCMNRKQCHHRI